MNQECNQLGAPSGRSISLSERDLADPDLSKITTFDGPVSAARTGVVPVVPTREMNILSIDKVYLVSQFVNQTYLQKS